VTEPRAATTGARSLPKRVVAARIRADLAEKRIKRREFARLTERSVRTIERWVSDAPANERYRPTRPELIVLAHLTGYPVSRYTGDERDDVLFPVGGKQAHA
jgi:hypothetical protein